MHLPSFHKDKDLDEKRSASAIMNRLTPMSDWESSSLVPELPLTDD